MAMPPLSPWKRPDEVMQLHRLKKKQKALQERMRNPATNLNTNSEPTNINLDFSKLNDNEKRKNPFSKSNNQESKKPKVQSYQLPEISVDTTLFSLINLTNAKRDDISMKKVDIDNTDKLSTFSNLLQKYSNDHQDVPVSVVKHKHIPVDWSLKTRLKVLSPTPFPWDNILKCHEEASGITGYVRCVEATRSQLDSSQHARLHQHCLYWQHPALPWLQLFPRAAGRLSQTGFLANQPAAAAALYTHWVESFRSLFQLLRARHCPYFYVCANTYTCLFRAAGIGGLAEPCALVAPTTRGFRQMLRQEEIEFSMPLRTKTKAKTSKLNNSDSQGDEKPKNASYDSCYDTMDDFKSQDCQKRDSQSLRTGSEELDGTCETYSQLSQNYKADSDKLNNENGGDNRHSQNSTNCSQSDYNSQNDLRCKSSQDFSQNNEYTDEFRDSDKGMCKTQEVNGKCHDGDEARDESDDDDLESDDFLVKLGLAEDVIKQMNCSQARSKQDAERSVDNSHESLVYMRGVEAQAFFNSLLNSRGVVSSTGPFAGVPPTLLAPTAFHGGTLQALKVRQSVVYVDKAKHYSVDLRGPILPTTVHHICDHMKAACPQFSLTCASLPATNAFSMASQGIADEESSKENDSGGVLNLFSKENLRDCGLSQPLLQHLCSSDPSLVRTVDALAYTRDDDTYQW